MDPNPEKFPLLSYVLAEGASQHTALVTERWPYLKDSKLIASMGDAIADLSRRPTRSMLQKLGNCPDVELVNIARLQLAEIEKSELEMNEEEEVRRLSLNAMISLYELYQSDENMFSEAEKRLEGLYNVAAEEVRKNIIRNVNYANQNLRELPSSVTADENLEVLHLSCNYLSILPNNFGSLGKLKILKVSNNYLKSLPSSLCHCRSLEELDVSCNQLKCFFPELRSTQLVNLKKLSVSSNPLGFLPHSVYNMRSLQFLYASNCELASLSPGIKDLSNLKELDVSSNKIHKLPLTLGCLEKLEKLNLINNPLVFPPKTVVDGELELVMEYLNKSWFDSEYDKEVRSKAVDGWLTRISRFFGWKR